MGRTNGSKNEKTKPKSRFIAIYKAGLKRSVIAQNYRMSWNTVSSIIRRSKLVSSNTISKRNRGFMLKKIIAFGLQVKYGVWLV